MISRGTIRINSPHVVVLILFVLSTVGTARAQSPRVYRDHITPHWFGDQARFWYRNDLPKGGREFILVDAEKASREPAFDHARAAKALGAFLKTDLRADHLPIDSVRFTDDGKSVILFNPDKILRLNFDDYTVTEASDEQRPPPEPAAFPFGRRGAGRRGAARRPTAEPRTA